MPHVFVPNGSFFTLFCWTCHTRPFFPCVNQTTHSQHPLKYLWCTNMLVVGANIEWHYLFVPTLDSSSGAFSNCSQQPSPDQDAPRNYGTAAASV